MVRKHTSTLRPGLGPSPDSGPRPSRDPDPNPSIAPGPGPGPDLGSGHGRGRRSGAIHPATVRPADLREVADVLREAAAADQALLFTGAGTALTWGARPTRTDLVVETTALDRLIRHDAADMTVTVQSGMPLTRLQQLLAPASQWLPFDPPAAAAGASLGGLLATADAGPLRLACGSLRDLVIGAVVVLADGTVARSGGQAIKNVAGYDLAKLFSGSLGAFGLVVELTLRVHPRPPASATVAVPAADAQQALVVGRAVAASPLDPVAVEWDGERVLIRFHGTVGGTAARVRRAAAVPGLAQAQQLQGEAERAVWDRLDELVSGSDDDTVLRAGTHPAHLTAVSKALADSARRSGVEASLSSSVALGVHTARLRGGAAADHAACLDAWRAAVHALGGTTMLRRRREGVETATQAWGPAPATAPLLASLKRQFDPSGRCAPGRFAPWF